MSRKMSNQPASEFLANNDDNHKKEKDIEHGREIPNRKPINDHETEVDAMPSSASDTEQEEKIPKKEIKQTGTKKTEHGIKISHNKRALTNLAPTYCLHLFNKNLLIIFNQFKVSGYLPREGTEVDVAALKNTWGRFGFETEDECYHDLTKAEIFEKLDSYTVRDFTAYGCIVVAVLTHGTYNGEIMAADELYSEHDILNSFKTETNPTLVTKPIIVLIQACRGTDRTKGAEVRPPAASTSDTDGPPRLPTLHYHLPIEADTLVFHSSYPGKLAWRPKDGSWFIQTLCKKIIEMEDMDDLETIFIEVKREVACDKYAEWDTRYVEWGKVYGEANQVQKQMPVVTSALQRKLYLVRKVADNHQQFRYEMAIPTDAVADVSQKQPLVTPRRTQLNDCKCIIDHMDAIRNCLGHFVNDKHYNGNNCHLNPETSRDSEKLSSIQVIINTYLQKACISEAYHHYMYFYGNRSKGNRHRTVGVGITQTWANAPAVLIIVCIICVIIYFVQKLFTI